MCRAGAERLLRHLHAHGVPFALATSSHQRHYAVKTQRHTDLFALFSHRVTGVRLDLGMCRFTGTLTLQWHDLQAGFHRTTRAGQAMQACKPLLSVYCSPPSD